jgi:DNA repair exonuclease SbcCD ATPase subunit
MSDFVRCDECEALEKKINQQTSRISELVSVLEPIEIPGIVDQEVYVPLAHSSEMIAIKVPVEPTKKEEVDYVQSTILALNQKIKLLQLLEQEKLEFTKLLNDSLKSAKDVSLSAEETYTQLKQDDEMHQKAIQEISNEIKNFLNLKQQETEKINDIENQIFTLTESKSQIQQTCQDLENEFKQNEALRNNIARTQSELESTEKERYDIFKQILTSAQEFREETKTIDSEAKRVEEENRKLRDNITELTQALEKEKRTKHELTRKKLQNMCTLQKLKGVKVLELEQKNYNLRYQQIAKNYQDNIDVMKQDLGKALTSYEKLIQKLHGHQSDIKKTIAEVQGRIKYTENRVAIQDGVIEGKG